MWRQFLKSVFQIAGNSCLSRLFFPMSGIHSRCHMHMDASERTFQDISRFFQTFRQLSCRDIFRTFQDISRPSGCNFFDQSGLEIDAWAVYMLQQFASNSPELWNVSGTIEIFPDISGHFRTLRDLPDQKCTKFQRAALCIQLYIYMYNYTVWNSVAVTRGFAARAELRSCRDEHAHVHVHAHMQRILESSIRTQAYVIQRHTHTHTTHAQDCTFI
jgi:hypothetical protein